ncbi:MAG: ABC transporter substrate-binding protein, partial [Candidatus Cloacimonadaceae bacterium]|nr:ABC transporter substrate-binding protein [Candidatus Cloacimonadaceae bacterium]
MTYLWQRSWTGGWLGIMLCLALLLPVLSCDKHKDILRVGIITPSVHHLPLSFAMYTGKIDAKAIQIIGFSAGWELQEALIAGKVDTAIIPFTYAWNMAAKGYPIRIVSFFERETDGVLVSPGIEKPEDLNGKKVGLIKASTLDVFFIEWAARNGIAFDPVYFRSPNEMIAALDAGMVSAIVAYEPLIQKISDKYSVLHWFGADYPHHPCCDFAVNTDRLDDKRKATLKQLLSDLHDPVEAVNLGEPDALAFMGKLFGLTRTQCDAALQKTVFTLGMGQSGLEVERR